MTNLVINIRTPCSESWQQMPGDERSKFCARCKINVLNFADMKQSEVEQVLRERGKSRLCARIVKRADGSLVTDNCPYKLRRIRNFYRAIAGVTAVVLLCMLQERVVLAQSLAHATTDSALADYSYDVARDVQRASTIVALVSSALFSFFRVTSAKNLVLSMNKRGVCARKTKGLVSRRCREALVLNVIGPLIVHLVGVFVVNNFASPTIGSI